MNFKKGLSKAQRLTTSSPVSSQTKSKGASVSLSGISFKKLEEDDDEEDLISYTGKYEKIVEQSQKAQKREQERSMSTSSVSSTSSGQEDHKPEKNNSATQPDLDQRQLNKAALSQPGEVLGSPLRSAARQKIETSKELFSGLKGKIAGKISKTIDEFAGDSNSSLSPEKEQEKHLPIDCTDGSNAVVQETVPTLGSAPPQQDVQPDIDAKGYKEPPEQILENSYDQEVEALGLSKEKTPVSAKDSISNGDGDDVFVVSSLAVEPALSNLKSTNVEDHPLAKTDEDDAFEDVIEPSKSEAPPDDSLEFSDPINGKSEDPTDILVFEEHFNTVGGDEASSVSGFSTTTKVKSRSSVIKRLAKKEPKTRAVATMSGLHDAPDEELLNFVPDTENKVKDNSGVEKGNKSKPQKHPSSLHIPDSSYSSVTSGNPTPPIGLHMLPFDPRALPYQRLVAVAVIIFAYLIVPLPSYMSGFLMGVILASLGWGLYMWLMEPPKPQEPFVIPPLEEETPPVPQMKITNEADEFTYKGWLNELAEYNVEDYHINKTHSVYISLEGHNLRIQRPKNPVPRRAMWDEVLPKAQFIHQRHFDLQGTSVYLAPTGLVKKRIWSKKYPICIDLNGDKHNGDSNATMKHISSDPNMSDKKDKSHVHGFEVVTEEKCEHKILYLFARTGREKEEWLRRFAAAAQGKPLGNHVLEMRRVINLWSPSSTRKMQNSGNDSSGQESIVEQPKGPEDDDLLPFAHYMGRLMPTGSLSRASSPAHSSFQHNKDANNKASTPKDGNGGGGIPVAGTNQKEGDEVKPVSPKGAIICDGQLFWVNALIGRCFFDFLRDKWWIGKVTEKLQRKLSKIHVPYFIEELQVTDIHMGYEIPAIRNAGKPYIDERGFWVDLDVTYSGGFTMTIETKMNLMKLKKSHHQSQSPGHSVDGTKSAITHSDEEDSAESSTDEEEEAPSTNDESGASTGGGSGKKFFRYLNKITQSRYFQQATEYSVIKRAMENVSNTPLTLTVTVNSLVGKLALNIPPPRSDRLWYGFRGNPLLRLSAKPQVGERAVKFTHVTEWIEKKLALEFQRIFVMPNMDDLVIPILVPGEVSGTGITHSVSL